MIVINTENKTITDNDGLEKKYQTAVCVGKDELGVWVDFGDSDSDVRRLLYHDTVIDDEQMTDELSVNCFGEPPEN